MNIYINLVFFTLMFLLLNDSDVNCKARGGGGRGGGSRSGGSRSGGYRSGSSRSGYRSGSSRTVIKSKTIISSSRYSSWSVRVGVSSGTRYRISPWSTQHRAIIAGHILMSHNQRTRFHIYDKSYYDDISVCFNEEPLYGRNITASPWFICPWDNLSERFCCGEEVQERCCSYFDRPGHLAGLIIGILILIFLICLVCFCYKRSHSVEKTTTVVYVANKSDTEFTEGPLLAYPPVPINTDCQPAGDPSPAYNNLPYPPYQNPPENNATYPNYPTENCAPYPNANDNKLPYPTGPAVTDNSVQNNYNPNLYGQQYPPSSYAPTSDNPLPYPVNPASGPITNTNPPYPINEQGMPSIANAPPMGNSNQALPSYEDALKINN